MNKYPEFYNSIPKSWDYLVGMLISACNDRQSTFRTMNIAYVDNNTPYCRTVVLRYCHNDLSYLQFHTDYHAPKVKILQENPNIAIHFYNSKTKTQLSMNGIASVHYMNNISENAWHNTPLLSRQCYIADNQHTNHLGESPSKIKTMAKNIFETEHGYYNFSVIKIIINTIDFLYLHGNGNKRIIFTKDTQNTDIFQGKWANP